MADRDQPTSPRYGASQTDRMRDPNYLVRGYKAALYNRNISDEDRQRARVGLDGGQPYDPAAARVLDEARGYMERSRSGGEKQRDDDRGE